MRRSTNMWVPERNGPLVGLVGLLVVGFVVGLIAGAIWAHISQEGLGESDYLVMVSMLYDRDRSIPNAVARLAILNDGDVVRAISSLADTYPRSHPEAQNEARALRQLASALTSPSGDVKVPTSSGSGIGSIWLVLGIALLFVCLLGIGGPFALHYVRTSRRRWPAPVAALVHRLDRLPSNRSLRRPLSGVGPSRNFRRAVTPENGPEALVGEPHHDVKREFSTTAGVAYSRDDAYPRATAGSLDLDALRHPRFGSGRSIKMERNGSGEPEAIQRNAGWIANPAANLGFRSHYQFGDEPFDSVHPITNEATGELIGACGMSAELKLSDEMPGRYYAFSVWAHDYRPGGRLKRIAIVSRWAKGHGPSELIRWLNRSMVEDVVTAAQDIQMLIDTANLAIGVTISGVSYGNDADIPLDSCIASLVATFEVNIKDPAKAR